MRPAFVLFASEYDVTVAFISTQMNLRESSDIEIEPTSSNGLRMQSLLKLSKIATIEMKLVRAIIGSIDSALIPRINASLKTLLQL